uniref:Uncharacterized protein n=1 Tax=Sphaerodactylus townsendi TaxID=933632 RepID=A0ACB8G235_9SAUR
MLGAEVGVPGIKVKIGIETMLSLDTEGISIDAEMYLDLKCTVVNSVEMEQEGLDGEAFGTEVILRWLTHATTLKPALVYSPIRS